MRQDLLVAGMACLGVALFAAGCGETLEHQPPLDPTNTVVFTNRSGSALTQYPVQIGRPFVQGEVADSPYALVEGVAVATQADVKQRYPDGSVKHCILSFLIPSLPADASVQVTFGNQTLNDDTPLSAGEMLAAELDFDAVLEMTSGASTSRASAREMLENGDFVYWTSGPIATTIVLADHSAARDYDLGFDSYRSIRPVFHATFWPALHKVRVRVIGENVNTTTLQDLAYDLTIRTGHQAPAVAYSKAGLVHYLGTRWTKELWLGGAPNPRVDVDHNLAYLGKTKFLPNYDPSLVIPENVQANNYGDWTSSAHDLYDEGGWTRYMPTTGGRGDIGPYTTWTGRWLFSGDWRAREVAFGRADLAAAWPLHWREGATGLFFDRAQTVDALGKPMSLTARPDLWFPDNNAFYSLILPTPRILDANGDTFGGWVQDTAHNPDPFSAQYLLSGDYWYLEELELWTAALAFMQAPGLYGRGLPGYGGVQDQIRGNAWALRGRVDAAFLSPDDTVEKEYFTRLVDDMAALWEGRLAITGNLEAHPQWSWAALNRSITPSPLHFYTEGATAVFWEALWEDYFFIIELGLAREKGFSTGPLLDWLGPVLVGQFADPGYDPHLVATYKTTIKDAGGVYYPTWAAIQSAMDPAEIANILAGFGHSNYYPLVASGAAAFTTYLPDGDTAWDWLGANARPLYDNPSDPVWAFLPRP